jgi:transglutaminase-like putative cysteine protease
LVLLLIVFGSVAYGVSNAVRGIEPGLLWPFVLIGLVLGWALACSRVPGWLVAIAGSLTGVLLTLLRAGQLGGPLVTLLGTIGNLAWQTLQGSIPPDTTALQTGWLDLVDNVGVMVTRLYTWMVSLSQGQLLYDPVPIAFLWGLALWGTVLWACWAVRRRAQPLLGIAPATALLVSTLVYVGGRAAYLLPVLAAALVLKAVVRYDRRRQRWEQSRLKYAPRVRRDTIWMAVGLSMMLTFVAAVTPSISVYRIVEFVQSLSQEPAEEEAARSLGLEPDAEAAQTAYTILDARRSGGLPTRHLIGSGPELSEQVVMVISIEPTHGVTQAVDLDHYWRGLTYDRYTERGWSTEYAVRATYEPGDLASAASPPNRRLLRQEVRLREDRSGLIYVAGSLLTADQEFRIAWRALPDSEQPGDVFGAMVEAASYRADSLLPVFGEADLRTAGEGYPAWVTERYLALPDTVPDRVLALARDLTATEPTPYDRALAIERYLRRFPYMLDLPSPPTDQDVVDYFLFDLQQGYCDYYASAMVVLARAAGLPARLVTGYLSGRYDEKEGQIIVTEAEAHSWVEIYFPGFGWIEFEPTAGRPAVERPAAAPVRIPPELQAPPEPITAHRARSNVFLWLGAAGGLFTVALGGLVVWLLVDDWRLRHRTAGEAMIGIYRRLYRHGRWLGVFARKGDTPCEFAEALALRVKEVTENRRWGALLTSAPEEIQWLIERSTRALYSSHEPESRERAMAIGKWRQLRLQLWLARALALFPSRSNLSRRKSGIVP